MLNLLVTRGVWWAIALVSQGAGGNGVTCSGTTSPTTCTMTQAALNGDVLVLLDTSTDNVSGDGVTSVSSTNTTWAKVVEHQGDGSHPVAGIWCGTISGGNSGTSVTINWTGGSVTQRDTVIELSGTNGCTTDPASPPTPTTGSTSTTVTTPSNTTLLVNDFVVGGYKGSAKTAGPTANQGGGTWTSLNEPGGSTANEFAYQIVGAASTFSFTYTVPSSTWSSVIAAFTPAAAAGTAAGNKRRKLLKLDQLFSLDTSGVRP